MNKIFLLEDKHRMVLYIYIHISKSFLYLYNTFFGPELKLYMNSFIQYKYHIFLGVNGTGIIAEEYFKIFFLLIHFLTYGNHE